MKNLNILLIMSLISFASCNKKEEKNLKSSSSLNQEKVIVEQEQAKKVETLLDDLENKQVQINKQLSDQIEQKVLSQFLNKDETQPDEETKEVKQEELIISVQKDLSKILREQLKLEDIDVQDIEIKTEGPTKLSEKVEELANSIDNDSTRDGEVSRDTKIITSELATEVAIKAEVIQAKETRKSNGEEEQKGEASSFNSVREKLNKKIQNNFCEMNQNICD